MVTEGFIYVYPATGPDDWCSHHPEFNEWIESQNAANTNRPCRQCGRETFVAAPNAAEAITGVAAPRGARVCPLGHHNGWEDVKPNPPAESHSQ